MTAPRLRRLWRRPGYRSIKSDRIASATRRTITENMDEDPPSTAVFQSCWRRQYRDYRAKRISERDYLKNVLDLAGKIARKDRGRAVPDAIKGNDDGQAFFGILEGTLARADGKPIGPDEVADIALDDHRHHKRPSHC